MIKVYLFLCGLKAASVANMESFFSNLSPVSGDDYSDRSMPLSSASCVSRMSAVSPFNQRKEFLVHHIPLDQNVYRICFTSKHDDCESMLSVGSGSGSASDSSVSSTTPSATRTNEQQSSDNKIYLTDANEKVAYV